MLRTCPFVCACARALSRPRANSSGSYLSYLFTRPSALSFIGTDYTADLPPSCQILRPGSCSGRIRGAFLVFVTQLCRSRSPRMSSFLCSLSRRPSLSFLFSPASNRCLSRESRSSRFPWLLTGRSLTRSQSVFINPRLSRFPLFYFFISLHLCLRPSLIPSLLLSSQSAALLPQPTPLKN